MGRPKRIQFAGACYLITLRGNNRQSLFLSTQDRRQFLALLKAHKERHGLKVYAYSLMEGRVDLLMETAQANLSAVMQGFNTQYTKYFNGAHGTVGHVFQGRYKAWIVDKDTHLAEMTRYVHLACVREGLKDKPWRSQWTSCAAYVEAKTREPLVDSEAVLREFGGGRLKQSVRYMHYIQNFKDAAGEHLPIVGGVAIGEAGFLETLAVHREAPAAARRVPIEDARRIIGEIAARQGVSEEKVMGRVRWREVAAARREAVHRIWKETGMSMTELARLFARTPSAISQMVHALEVGSNI